MNGLIVVVLLAIGAFGANANPFAAILDPRIGGTPTLAVDALHAVMVIVVRDDHEEGRGALGGGSIVTRNRVVTAAHVVREALSVSVGFYVNVDLLPRNLRRAEATFWQTFSRFEPSDLHYDIAVLQFANNAFPAANVIPISNAAPPAAGFVASYGFTTTGGVTASRQPLRAAHTVAACADEFAQTDTHFCAGATTPSIVCNGDNGSGLYSGTGGTPAARLVGLVSTLSSTTCDTPGQTAFTALNEERIRAFLVSQGIEPVAPPPPPPPAPTP